VANFQVAARRHNQRLDAMMQDSEETNIVAKTIGDSPRFHGKHLAQVIT